ncbi:MAG TPA: winged helix-turn-helix transcriptional regulator [Pyrinomonadaceae bacterium]|jgi:tetratricopeptide (TPR) repeat protein|nr:winged helix-turn-helix transcriptional regulator [Pyrinomonadaceae bacterium]
MGKRSRFRHRGKNKKSGNHPAVTIPDGSSAVPDEGLQKRVDKCFENHDFETIIELLREQEKTTHLTDSQLIDLAEALLFGDRENYPDSALETIQKVKSPTPQARRIEVWGYMGKCEWDKAIKISEDLLEVDDSPSTRYVLCLALLKDRGIYQLFSTYGVDDEVLAERKETLERLKTVLETAVTQENCRPICFCWLEQIWWQENNHEVYEDGRNISLLKQALSLYPDDEEIRHQLAWRLNQSGDAKAAMEVLKWALTAKRPSGTILLQGADISTRIGEYNTALTFLDRAESLELVSGAGKDLFKAILLANTDQTDAALSLYQSLAENTEDKNAQFSGLINIALSAALQGRKDEAVEYAVRAAQLWWENIRESDTFYDYVSWPSVDFTPAPYDRFSYFPLEGERFEIIPELAASIIDRLDNFNDLRFARLLYLFYIACSNQDEQQADLIKRIAGSFTRVSHLLDSPAVLSRAEEAYKQLGDLPSAFNAHVHFCSHALRLEQHFYTSFGSDAYDEEGNEIDLEKVVDKKAATAIHKNFLKQLKSAALDVKENVLRPIFIDDLCPLFSAYDMHKQIIESSDRLLKDFPDNTELLWKHAYYSYKERSLIPAQKSYRHLLQLQPDNYSVLHNLALIQDDVGDLQEAVELSDKAVALAPNDELITRINSHLKEKIKTSEEAKAKWETLDFYKKKILYTLRSDGFKNYASLASKTGIEEKSLRGHCRRLVDQGWITEIGERQCKLSDLSLLLPTETLLKATNSTYRSDTGTGGRPARTNLPDNSEQYGIKTRFVIANNSNAIKPIFNSKNEYRFYCEFVHLFPQHKVIPNMALQSIFSYSVMKDLLSPDDFNYYLKAQVDICIVSMINFLPRYAFEIDSVFHDKEEQITRDDRKNRIFRVGNLPLIRMRPLRITTSEEIRDEIIKAMRSLPEHFRGISTNLSLELDT